jgi:glutathione reductase (NADPH)
MSTTDYELVVLGGGSGGSAVSQRAAEYLGAGKVCIIEQGPTRDAQGVRTGAGCGGTCVNVGCVPKKLMFIAASQMEALAGGTSTAQAFGLELPADAGKLADCKLDWPALKEKRDKYTQGLEKGYKTKWESKGVTVLTGMASFNGPKTVQITAADGSTQSVAGKHVVVAVGGVPSLPTGVPGAELGITSDGFFDLATQPKKAAVIGAGYIAVEMAGIMHALGTEVDLFCRGASTLRRGFEPDIVGALHALMASHGPTVVPNAEVASITKAGGRLLQLTLKDGRALGGYDCVLFAIGRAPATAALGLAVAGIATDGKGQVVVDDFEDTNVPGVHALGDVTTRGWELTPVAIAAGRRLADRLFGGAPAIRLPYEDIPTVVFSHPPIATCGLTSVDAAARYGAENIRVQKAAFGGMLYAFNEEARRGKTVFRVVLKLPEERVVGLHMLGPGVDEILQGFAVAIGMGATRADFEQTVAIHPTSAEELVTMGGWGQSSDGKRTPLPPPKLSPPAPDGAPRTILVAGVALVVGIGLGVALCVGALPSPHCTTQL